MLLCFCSFVFLCFWFNIWSQRLKLRSQLEELRRFRKQLSWQTKAWQCWLWRGSLIPFLPSQLFQVPRKTVSSSDIWNILQRKRSWTGQAKKNIWWTRYIAAALREDPTNEDPASSFSTGIPPQILHIHPYLLEWVALAGQHLPLIRLDKPHLQYDNTQGKGSSAPQLSVKKRNYSSLLPTLQVSSMRLPFQPEALVYCGAKLARDLVGLWGWNWVKGVVLLVALSWVGLALCLCVPSLTTFIKIKDPIASAQWLAWGAHCRGRGALSCWKLPYILHQT